MHKILICFFLLWTSLEAKIDVLVSIAPQKFLVEKIGQEQVTVDIVVPPGANSHTFEPTPRQILLAQKKQIWFRLGEGFEARMLSSLKKNTEIVDQRDGIDLIMAGCGCCNARDCFDPHIWLSPRLLKIQARQIAHTLQKYDPEHQEFYAQNLLQLEQELTQLDEECCALFAHATQRTILVSHPAFGYFCRDYGLTQLSVETEGREPTPKALTELICEARRLNIKMVFLQKQHNPKGGMRIAKEIGADTCYIDPYIENVIQNLREIAKLFSA